MEGSASSQGPCMSDQRTRQIYRVANVAHPKEDMALFRFLLLVPFHSMALASAILMEMGFGAHIALQAQSALKDQEADTCLKASVPHDVGTGRFWCRKKE